MSAATQENMESDSGQGIDVGITQRERTGSQDSLRNDIPMSTSPDELVAWIETKTQGAMKHIKPDNFRKLFRTVENKRVIEEFFSSPDVRCLLILGNQIVATIKPPSSTPKGCKIVYFIKVSAVASIIPMEDAEDEGEDAFQREQSFSLGVGGQLPGSVTTTFQPQQSILFGEIAQEPLTHLERIIQDIYLPLLGNPANQDGWGEVASKEIMDKLHHFLANVSITVGHTQGQTCLPLPVGDLQNPTSNVASKDRIHLLEGAVITWTKQIKNVLKQDPEGLLKMGLFPTPDKEVEFWRFKASNLNSIFDQLQGEKIRRVLRSLDASKSTYCNPFAKLCKEVFTARVEANDNVKYISALEPWFEQLNHMQDFQGLTKLFKPIMHIMLRIWKSSMYYNTPARLVILMREICNALIIQACSFVSGRQIFELIESNQAGEAVDKLKITLKVCGTFKSTYFDYKATANTECPSNPWRIQNNALFMRLDAFLERCHDILDLTQTIVQFTNLSKIEVGGTKGKTLTTSVAQIYSDFRSAVEDFQQVQYDILDVGAKQFDDDFYEFRCKIKEMERRLGSVLIQGFDDAATLRGRFKLLDSFESLLERPIIQDELEKKYLSLLHAFGQDLRSIQDMFHHERENPPRAQNLPPATGAIYWCNGLINRIEYPMEKLRTISRAILERDEAKDVVRLYNNVMAMLTEYCRETGKKWCKSMDATAASKLKLPLLVHKGPKKQLEVNFDPELVALLREVKYFMLLGMEVPEFALELNKKETMFRTWRGKLQLCVNKYNSMVSLMLPVEAPLVRTQIERIHSVVETGLTLLTWKSHGIDNFIEKAEMAVNDAEMMLSALKVNLNRIQNILESWSETSFFQRSSKPVAVQEFNQLHKTRIAARYQQVADGSKEIHRLLKDSNKTLRISAGHPEWRAYVDFVNNVVVAGLANVCQRSLEYLNEQIEQDNIIQTENSETVPNTQPNGSGDQEATNPMLTVKINLNNNFVTYIPSVLDEDKTGIRYSVKSWIEDVFRIGTMVKRLDLGEGTYVREIQQDLGVTTYLAKIFDNLMINESKCREFQQQFDKYSFLWKSDMSSLFAEFIRDATLSSTATGRQRLDLNEFDAAMNRLNAIKEEVSLLKTPTNIGWLRVDSTPIKENIVHWVHKWLYQYIGYLREDVVNKLTELRGFVKRTRSNLEREVDPGDTDTLMSVMGSIRDVRQRMGDTTEMLDPLKATVLLLRQHKVELHDEVICGEDEDDQESLLEFLESGGMKWDSLVNFTFRIKEQIMPMQNQEVETINSSLSKFANNLEAFRENFKQGAPFSFSGTPDEAYKIISRYQSLFESKKEQADHLNGLQELFELQVTKYRVLTQTKEELRMLKTLWDCKAKVIITYSSWHSVLWKQLDVEAMGDENRKLQQELKQLGKQDPACTTYQVYNDIQNAIQDMSVVLPLIGELHSPAMRARHWKAITATCKVPAINWDHDSFCFESILQLQLQRHSEDILEQVETAEKELTIEKKLELVESRWETLKLDWYDTANNTPTSVLPDVDPSTLVFLPRPSDEVIEALEGDQTELQVMIGMGKFVKYFKDRVTKWANTLSDIEENLKDWINVSKQWASLESIFLASPDIRTQLPDDTKRFEGIDQEFRDLQRRAVNESPLVVKRCTEDGLSELLKRILQDLQKCQKALNEYLDTKKKIFPRFYFVSNNVLLNILSNGNCPKRIMPHLADCYDAIDSLVFSNPSAENPTSAVAMVSTDGEEVQFTNTLHMEGAVEVWLNKLTETQVLTLKNILRAAIDSGANWEVEKPRQEWLFDFPSQVVLQGSQVFWTEDTESALEELEGGNEDSVRTFLDVCNNRLQALIQLVEGELTKADRTKIIALITMDVHGRDVVQRLIDEKAEGPLSFLWQQQLRSYWQTGSIHMDTDIRICDFRAKYSYEYVGNCSRLVITPLTDRCYITLATAMRLMRGGAPAGPAGTGKTETTKDLARALALPCYVFNCSDQMNFQTLGDIFKGLSQTGAWGCFDEFNRIPIEVLSVVATQVKLVLDAVAHFSDPSRRPALFREAAGHLGDVAGTPPCKVGKFDFLGDELELIPTTGFFITMNPGYAGRTELPENLKALFRSCAMIRPDLSLICENMLMAEGFQRARALSVKFVTLYQLSAELLSSQPHYDWGLRAIKSVLQVAGRLKRSNKDMDEEPVLMRALRDFNVPKIPESDLPIFLRLISDLFPKFADCTPAVSDDTLKSVAAQVCSTFVPKVQPVDNFLNKVVQFQQILDVRHSVMLIGCAGSGKTTIWQTLLRCINELGRANNGTKKDTAVAEVIEPKAITSDELYGSMTLSKDWKDGALSICMRGMSKNQRDLGYHEYQTSKWVVLDGDIDANWIESMNTVMDDNKVLTLVSNERIPLSDAMRMIFEIDSLKNATPATVSRAGIIFVNERDIGWQPFVDSWIERVSHSNQPVQAKLHALMYQYLPNLVKMFQSKLIKTIIPTFAINHVQTACYLLESFLPVWTHHNEEPELLEQFFAFSCAWGFGGAISDDKGNTCRLRFNKEFCSLFFSSLRGCPCVSSGGGGSQLGGSSSGSDTIFNYFVDPTLDVDNRWVSWESSLEDYMPITIGDGPGKTPFSSLYVNTLESTRLTYLLDTFLPQQRPVMFVGPAGTGKTMLVRNYLKDLVRSDENMLMSTVVMNYFMDSAALQRHVEGVVDKRSGHRFGPPGNKRLALFVDDINLPYVEDYGTQNAIALLRQLMTHKSCFDRHDLGFKKEIVDVRYVAAMNPTAGSFNISDRAQVQFATFACCMPGEKSLRSLYVSILEGHMTSFSASVDFMVEPLVDATLDIYRRVSDKFLPSASKFVYSWNMRELAAVFQGICRATPEHFTTPLALCRLWLHESRRVFGDRLVEQTDMSRFEDIVNDVSKSFSLDDYEKLREEPLVFTTFAGPDSNLGAYYPVESEVSLKRALDEKLAEYNERFPVMDLVLFEDASRHLTRIARIIGQSSGNALLVGVGGSGKQSLSKLAAYICGCEIAQMSITSEFTTAMLIEKLQELFKQTGVKGVPTCWIVTDSQIVNENFLVYINDILSNGWIADIFPKDDLPGVLDGLRGELRAAGISDTLQDKVDLMISRVRQYLHVVLCCSPVGDTFRVRSRRFPGLVNTTNIDWFHPWPEEALVSVASRFLSDVSFGDNETKENVAYHMASVHLEVTKVSERYLKQERRFNYVTPKTFLEFIAFYKNLLSSRRAEMHDLISRLQHGLDVLQRTSERVSDLQQDLKVTMFNVEEKKAASEALMEQIGVKRADAEHKKELAATEAQKANEAALRASEIERDASEDLLRATPAMEAAAEAVQCLNKKSLTELKSLSKPPAGVDQVTKCCLMMVENEFKNFKWDRAKKMMSNVDKFLEKLQEFDAENMDEVLVEKLETVVFDPEFTYDNMIKKSQAAANLCNWVINIHKYNRIYVEVKPKMDRLRESQAEKAAAEAKVAEVDRIVAGVEARLLELKTTFLKATEEKMTVEALASQCMAKLDLANRLVKGLAAENKRWGVDVESLKNNELNLVGTTLLASSFVGYVGGFDTNYREMLWKDAWLRDLIERELPIGDSTTLDPLNALINDSQTARMMEQGLPADRVSLENGAIISSSTRWPLIIDPQEQGLKWLKGKYSKIGDDGVLIPPTITQLNSPTWVQDVARAIEGGEVVMIENMGSEIDSTLDPVLSRAIVRKGRNVFIQFAGRELEYDENFTLVMLTKLSNPHYKPEVQAQCTLVNFIATEQGLEDQLLARVVQVERPDKEEEQQKLMKDFNHFRIQLTSLEDQLLFKLANAPEDILSDVPLIESLESTKQEAEKINDAVAAGQVVMAEISKIRDSYRSVASEASMLYFMLNKLGSVNHMYQYSLDTFVQFFYKSVSVAPASKTVSERVEHLRSTLRFTIYTWISRGLFEDHKLVFMANLTFNLLRRGQLNTEWNSEAFNFLLRGPGPAYSDNPLPDWLPDSAWAAVESLSHLEDFARLPSDMIEAPSRFKDWFSLQEPESEKLPLDWSHLDRTPLLKLLVTRCMRPDRMTVAVEKFARSLLPNGNQYADCDSTLNSFEVVKDTFADSSPTVPIYFILSPGANIVADVDRLAKLHGMVKGKTYHNVSMGQGQDRVAEELLDLANQEGNWVLLNNVHLMPSWLLKLERLLDGYATNGSHKNFRLFLSSDPSPRIPIGLLSNCIKLTNEPPSGLKANLTRAFCLFSKEYVEDADSKTKAILFGLCHFHSVLTERKKFGSKGYNLMYPFSLGDLQDSATCLNNYMENSTGGLPWDDLKYIFGEIIYGGHIVNDFDRLLAKTYLDYYMRDELLDEMELFPFVEENGGGSSNSSATVFGNNGKLISFLSPTPTTYERYLEHINEGIESSTPLAFGMHPNAEIGFRTALSQNMFSTLLSLQPRAASGEAEGEENSPQLTAENYTNEILDRFAEQQLDIDSIRSSAADLGPLQNVFLQECEAVNRLLCEMSRSLEELTLGFAGEFTMSDSMEKLMDNLYLGTVPQSWSCLVWPSVRNLALWLVDLTNRITQLQDWVSNPTEVPRAVWISGLHNPSSFLTAVKQITAQRTGAELDKLLIQTEITQKVSLEDVQNSSREGVYTYGLFIEGARWDVDGGHIETSQPKELYCPMPIINCKAVPADRIEVMNIFHCPCYKTEKRNSTYVFTAQLRTKSAPARWVLAGVALLMDVGV